MAVFFLLLNINNQFRKPFKLLKQLKYINKIIMFNSYFCNAKRRHIIIFCLRVKYETPILEIVTHD